MPSWKQWLADPGNWKNIAIFGGILFILPIIAYFTLPGIMSTVITANFYAMVGIPLGLMTIGTGRLNFGPNLYIGIGGYAAALLSVHLGWGPLFTFPFAVIASVLVALGFSPTVNISKGLYFVLLSLLMPLIFLELTFVYSNIFKGDVGLSGITQFIATGSPKLNVFILCYFSLIIVLLYLYATHKLINSRYGIMMSTINDDEEVAEGIGIKIRKVKILMFVLSAGMIGVSGWFMAHYFGTFAGISYLPLTFMMKILLVLILGGRAQIHGCVVGAYFIAFLEMFLSRTLGFVQPIVFPVILFILLLALPEGLFGLFRKRKYGEYMPTLHVRR
ncbi:MAG: branched-chain amino acid ABC transporter permease [Desulfobacteraceae bacterium]|nr:branched-chain amino acid ABC transporter permease [Desulfobacteraceae bacterium]